MVFVWDMPLHNYWMYKHLLKFRDYLHHEFMCLPLTSNISGKIIWQFLKKLHKEFPYDPATSFLGIYTKEAKICSQTHTCTRMFITAQFTIAKSLKQLKCPATDERIDKMCSIPNNRLLSHKQNEISNIRDSVDLKMLCWVT